MHGPQQMFKVPLHMKLDGCIVRNAHNTVFGWKAICSQAVYFLHLKMPIVSLPATEWCQRYLLGYLFSFQSRPAFLPCRQPDVVHCMVRGLSAITELIVSKNLSIDSYVAVSSLSQKIWMLTSQLKYSLMTYCLCYRLWNELCHNSAAYNV